MNDYPRQDLADILEAASESEMPAYPTPPNGDAKAFREDIEAKHGTGSRELTDEELAGVRANPNAAAAEQIARTAFGATFESQLDDFAEEG